MPQDSVPFGQTSSSLFPAKERFERWRVGQGSSYCASLPKGLRADQFHFDFAFLRFNKFLFNHASFAPRAQERTHRIIRQDQLDHYRLTLLNEGTLHSDADGVARVVKPGEVLVTDMSRPELFASSAGATVALFIPREVLDEALPRACDLHGFVLGGRVSQLLTSHMRGLMSVAPSLSAQEINPLGDATINLVAAALTPSARTLDHAKPIIESTLLRQVCRYIDLHVKEPGLSVTQLSGFFKISPATLYRMFASLGGVQGFITERRLARAHELLTSSSARVHLVRLSAELGFNNPTIFGRQFRNQYGCSPSDVLRGDRGTANPASSGIGSDPKAFGHFLRGLRD
ncbi:helix-turn-helix domain-containing protein [Variovorax robiniae]|uniref:Helix-turn-helix domain-containing protein n=1 Tax=Variovorax robiniae TaxID=1836199 RepID=A0ABU8X8D2_9BURK